MKVVEGRAQFRYRQVNTEYVHKIFGDIFRFFFSVINAQVSLWELEIFTLVRIRLSSKFAFSNLLVLFNPYC